MAAAAAQPAVLNVRVIVRFHEGAHPKRMRSGVSRFLHLNYIAMEDDDT
jgi:hypothetical protein